MNETVLISGAGIAGSTLAYWLAHFGFRPALVERAPKLRTGGYIIDFWGAGFDVAERMQLLPQLRRLGYAPLAVAIVNQSGRQIGGFGTDRLTRALDHRYLSILRGDLAGLIYQALEDRVETIFGDSIRALREDATAVEVEFERAAPRRFDLIIGADGLHSGVRRLTFGPQESQEAYLGYCAASFIARRYPHRDPDMYVAYCTPGRMMARFALRDVGTVFFMVFAAEAKPNLDHHDSNAHKAIVRDAFGSAGWECREIMDALDESGELYFDSVSQIRMPLWHRGRVALIGDAAFCPSLLAGEGASLAMAAAYVLAGELLRAGGDFGAAYPAYQELLKPFIEDKQRRAVGFVRQFAPKTEVGLFARNLLSRLFDVPVLADVLVRRMFADRLSLPEYG